MDPLDPHNSLNSARFGRRWLCCLVLAVSPQVLADAAAEDKSGEALDWVPAEELTEAQRQALPDGCCGAYVAPPRDDADANLPPEQAPVRATADRSEARRQDHYTLEGDVELTQGNRSLQAERAELDNTSREADIRGDIQIREPGVLLRGERAQMDMDTGDATLEDARFVLYETRVRGRAERLTKLGERFIGLDDSALTTCEPGDSAWVLKGKEINIYNQKHYGTARHARMEVFHVPVFYTPYLRFPIGDHRQTGFLFPSLSDSSRNGVEFSVPFYWNIAPTLDATITAEHMVKRGTLWDLETRHLSRHFETRFTGGYLSEDEGRYDGSQRAVGETGEEEEGLNPYYGEERWRLRLEQEGGSSERWSTQIDYTDLSDNDYLRDFNSSGMDIDRTATVAKMARAGYQGDHWLLGIKAEELRALSTGKWPHRELPRINADGRYRWGDWELQLNNEYAYFDVNNTYAEENPEQVELLPTGERLRTDYGLTWDKEWMWGFFKPSAMVKTLSYRLDEDNLLEGTDPEPALVVPQGVLDMGLYFERDGQLFGRGFLQTLEPRIFYFYSDYEDHSDLFGLTAPNRPLLFDTKEPTFQYNQLYRTSRFTGGDRIDDANQVSLGVTSRFIDPLTGVEQLSMSLGQIFYFADRRVGLATPDLEYDPEADPEADPPEETYERSELAAQLSARVGQRVNFNASATYSEVESRLGSANASLRYIDPSDRIVHLGYRYTHRPPSPGFEDPTAEQERAMDQVDFGIHLPIAGQWSLVGRANYDFTYDKELDTFVGLEYNDCCYRVRLLARRWLDFDYTPDFLETVDSDDYDQSIIFDFQFKGLGSVNRSVNDLLEKAIPGYGTRDGSLQ